MIVIKENEKFVIGLAICKWKLVKGKPQISQIGVMSPLGNTTPKKKKRIKKSQNGNN